MASTNAHVPLHIPVVHHEIPPSPTLTNPDMILPFDEQQDLSTLLPPNPPSSDNQADFVSTSSFDGITPSARPRSDSDAEVGIATAVALPMLVRGRVATTVAAAPAAAAYHGYEHGAPLSDIGEEAEEALIRSQGSSPDRSRSSSKQGPPLRHKKRLSNLSSSSGGSDKNEQWDRFDTSQLMSDRVAADIAQARNDADDNENEDPESRRNSKEVEEELAVLNEHAEKILANARKRLSSMEDNLTKARHSILLSPRSIPNMHELGHQPAGGLYRSISQNAQNRRSKGLFPSVKSMGLQHVRTGSEMGSMSNLKRLSGVPEPRSASAMDFSPARYGVGFLTSELKPSPPSKINTHSPSSSRSYNSPLRILAEEGELETPSTVKTSPDESLPGASSFLQARGLGIHASGTKAQEDLTQIQYSSSESPESMHRSSSQASARSARELIDQMSEMKNRIADLKNKAQADTLRRRSMQSLRTPSPFLNSNVNGHGAEGWYTGAGPSNYQQQSTTPTGQPDDFWTASPRRGHERKDSALESIDDQPPPPQHVLDDEPEPENEHPPVTPVAARLLHATDGTPIHPSSARTDRNTPNLVSKMTNVVQPTLDESALELPDAGSDEVDREFDTSEEDDGPIASSQEEQIYLNEVLEESLHDIEPGVPHIPGEYLVGDEMTDLQGEQTERHEDRLDAFDYENMFLHSAMGTYRGDAYSDDSDNDSIVTSRENARTPTATYVYEGEEDEDDTIIEKEHHVAVSQQKPDSNSHIRQPSSPSSARGRATPVQQRGWSPVSPGAQPRSPLRDANGRLRTPTQPWASINRTKSMETVSSVASYQTAAEGDEEYDDEDEDFHDEILNWGNAPPHHHTTGQSQHLSTHGVSAKAQNVLGWPAPPAAPGNARHSSHVRPHQSNLPSGHLRTGSGGSARSLPGRSPLSSVQYSAFPFQSQAPVQPPPNQPLPPPPPQAQTQAVVTHQANTEILMESLIKLADPEFSIESTGRSNFADIDKELVLGLLRAVGGVCDGVLRAQHGRRSNVVKELRERLMNAKDVLVGVAEQEGLEGIMEDDEDVE